MNVVGWLEHAKVFLVLSIHRQRYLREKVMQHVSANVMVNLVEDAVVPVNGGQAASQVTPLLCHTIQTLLYCLLHGMTPQQAHVTQPY